MRGQGPVGFLRHVSEGSLGKQHAEFRVHPIHHRLQGTEILGQVLDLSPGSLELLLGLLVNFNVRPPASEEYIILSPPPPKKKIVGRFPLALPRTFWPCRLFFHREKKRLPPA